ncbi:MAG TPA: hypothetical protein PK939_03460 [Bacteroidales bacterium]|nr:hypothetical protein [Bacteroidales bacterium]HQQ12179.1 hypothetical protein [Bacteroidales bacterium]
MKRINFLLAAMLLSFSLLAQERSGNEYRTLFGNRQHGANGGYGAFSMGFGRIDDTDAFFGGMKGGWVVDHSLTIGLAGYGFMNNFDVNMSPGSVSRHLTGGYGGLLIEPIIAPFSPIHLTVPIILGAGGIAQVDQYYYSDYYYEPVVRDASAYFVVQPGLELELNIVRFMRFAAGASYRFTSDITIDGVSDKALNGFMGHFTLKFGRF